MLQQIAQEAGKKNHLMLIPARYEGMDSRVEEYYADQMISIGDFVLMGGDLPAMILLEGIIAIIFQEWLENKNRCKRIHSGPFCRLP